MRNVPHSNEERPSGQERTDRPGHKFRPRVMKAMTAQSGPNDFNNLGKLQLN